VGLKSLLKVRLRSGHGFTFGEGWHHNHHAHLQSSRHGLAWYEFDPNWYGITALRMVGLAWDVKADKLHPTLTQTETAQPV
jgi:fatty-acid desaturase